MPNVGPMELLVVLVIALIVFGPKKLPEIGRGVGSAIREFKRASRDLMSHFEIDDSEPPRSYPAATAIYPEATSPDLEASRLPEENTALPPGQAPEGTVSALPGEAPGDTDSASAERSPHEAVPPSWEQSPEEIASASGDRSSDGTDSAADDRSSEETAPARPAVVPPSNMHPTA